MANQEEKKQRSTELPNWDIYKEDRRILRNAMFNNKLVIFVGAGVSAESGMPRWGEAITEFKKALNIGEEEQDYLKIPQLYYNARGQKEYVEFARDKFMHGKELKPNRLHKKILEFNANIIVTTNYDTLLENVAREEGILDYEVISKDTDIPYIKSDKLIIKMHGDFQNGNFVLKEDDYLNYSDNFKLIETYIKAIISRNVVLFVGYGFGDSDLKQIFVWLKSILDKDMQRAYMIETFKDFNSYNEDYYRNLGVNMIYSSEIYGSQGKGLSSGDKLYEILDWIVKDDEINQNTVKKIYNDLEPLNQLNYVFRKYVVDIMENYGICYNKKTLRLQSYPFGDRKEHGEVFRQIIRKGEDNYADVIHEVLYKSGFTGIASSDVEEDIFCESEITKNVIMFNYRGLENLRKQYMHDFELDNPVKCIEIAYIYYSLDHMEEAYGYLKLATKGFKSQNNGLWYFISALNQKWVGRYVCRSTSCSPDLCDWIKDEIEKINLMKIAKDTEFSENDVSFIDDLKNMQLGNKLFLELYLKRDDLYKEANTMYFLHTEFPVYIEYGQSVKNYLLYMMENFLMVDRLDVNKNTFRYYVESLISGMVDGKKTKSERKNFGVAEGFNGLEVKNYYPEELYMMELFLIIKYLDLKELDMLFQKYKVNHIDIEESGLQYLEDIFDNIIEISKGTDQRFWVLVNLMSKMEISQELIKKTIYELINRVSYGEMRNNGSYVMQFLFNQSQNGKFESDELGRTLLSYLRRLIQIEVEGELSSEKFLFNLIELIISICKENNIKNSVNDEATMDLNNQNLQELIYIFPVCNEGTKQQIKEKVKEKLMEKMEIEWYYKSLGYEIIVPSDEFENKLWEKVSTRNTSEDLYDMILNLLLAKKIKNKDAATEYLAKRNDPFTQFLLNREGYDFESFQLEWLLQCGGSLLKELANEENVVKNIRLHYKKAFDKGTLNEKLTKIYFEYFL